MKPTLDGYARRLPACAGLLLFLFLLYAAGVLSRELGLFDDELWDFTPAIATIRADSLVHAQEIDIAGHPIPIVTGPYQGALKTWILAPILMVFGTSPRFLLSLNVMFAMVYLGALYWALSSVVGKRWGCLAFAVPFVDTNILLTAPMDSGPSLFQYIFISLAAGALFRYMASQGLRYCWLTWLFGGCILAQKLTAVPIVLSLIAAVCFVSIGRFRGLLAAGKAAKAIGSYLAIPFALFALPLLPHFIYFLKAGFSDLVSMTSPDRHTAYFAALRGNLAYVRGMSDGADWYRRMTLDTASAAAETVPFLALIGAAAAVCSLALCLCRGEERRKYGHYSAVSFGLCAAAFFVYPLFAGLDRPWHFFVLMPPFICGVVISVVHIVSTVESRFGKSVFLVRCAVTAGLAAGIISGSIHGSRMLRRIEDIKGVGMTSPALYDTFSAIEAAKVRTIHALNYSLGYPLYVLARGSLRVEELAWTKLTDEKIGELFREVESDPGDAILYRFCGFKEADGDWIRWLNREPEIFEFMKRLECEKNNVSIERLRDGRQTEFILIRRKDR